MISLGGRITEPMMAFGIVDKFLSTDFEGGRHAARLKQFPDAA